MKKASSKPQVKIEALKWVWFFGRMSQSYEKQSDRFLFYYCLTWPGYPNLKPIPAQYYKNHNRYMDWMYLIVVFVVVLKSFLLVTELNLYSNPCFWLVWSREWLELGIYKISLTLYLLLVGHSL